MNFLNQTSKPKKQNLKSFPWSARFFLVLCGCILVQVSCSVVATRPVQEMSDTVAAIRAAREVQGDVLAPDLFREANEYFFKAKHEYKYKNFQLAREYAGKARRFAERAEFEAVRNGGNRVDQPVSDPLAEGLQQETSSKKVKADSAPAPYEYPSPEGTPADAYDQRKAEREAQQKENETKRLPPAPKTYGTPFPMPS